MTQCLSWDPECLELLLAEMSAFLDAELGERIKSSSRQSWSYISAWMVNYDKQGSGQSWKYKFIKT